MAVKRSIAQELTRRMKTPLLRPFQSSVTRRFTSGAVVLLDLFSSLDWDDQSDGGGRNEEMGLH